MLKFTIPGRPLVWKAPFVGTKGAYSVRTPIMEQIKHKLREEMKVPIISEAVELVVAFYLPIPKATAKKKIDLMLKGTIRPHGGGDLTNYLKFIEDCLQGTVLVNDNLVSEVKAGKYYALEPRTEIQLEHLV